MPLKGKAKGTYATIDGKVCGPLDDKAPRRAIASGRITPDTPLSESVDGIAFAAKDFRGLFARETAEQESNEGEVDKFVALGSVAFALEILAIVACASAALVCCVPLIREEVVLGLSTARAR